MIEHMKWWLSGATKTYGLVHFLIWFIIGAVFSFIVCYPMFNHFFIQPAINM